MQSRFSRAFSIIAIEVSALRLKVAKGSERVLSFQESRALKRAFSLWPNGISVRSLQTLRLAWNVSHSSTISSFADIFNYCLRRHFLFESCNQRIRRESQIACCNVFWYTYVNILLLYVTLLFQKHWCYMIMMIYIIDRPCVHFLPNFFIIVVWIYTANLGSNGWIVCPMIKNKIYIYTYICERYHALQINIMIRKSFTFANIFISCTFNYKLYKLT